MVCRLYFLFLHFNEVTEWERTAFSLFVFMVESAFKIAQALGHQVFAHFFILKFFVGGLSASRSKHMSLVIVQRKTDMCFGHVARRLGQTIVR